MADGISRFRFAGRTILFGIVLATMLRPWQVATVPTFLWFRELNMLNSRSPQIIPSFFGGSRRS